MKFSPNPIALHISPRRSLPVAGFLVLGSLTLPGVAHARTEPVETLVVTGEIVDKEMKDVTSAVTVISAERLESGEYNHAKETSVLAPNVIASSFSNISIRGISGGGAATGGLAYLTGARARVVTVVDGVTQDYSGYNYSPVALWDADQLEILRGPQSTAQGASAIGGALVVKTKDPTFYREAALRGGIENYENGHMKYNLGVMTSGAIIEDELAYRLVVDGTKGEGWLNYETSGYHTPNLSDSQSVNARGKLLWQPTGVPALTARLTLNYSDNEGEHANFASNTDAGIENKTFTLNGVNEVRIQDSDSNAIAADIDYQINDGVTNSLHLSRASSDIHDDAYSTGYTYDVENKTYTLENRVTFAPDSDTLSGVLGVFVSNKDASLSASNFNISTDYETLTTAVYGEGTYPLSDKTRVVAGLRIEHEDSDKSSATSYSGGTSDQSDSDVYFLPKLSLMHDIVPSTTVAASFSRGYSPSGVGISFFGEEYSYDSETVSAYELSSKSTFSGGSSVNANLFYNDYRNYQAGTSSFTIVNVDQSYTYGLEIEGVTWLSNDLELRSALGWLESKIDGDDSYKGNDLTDAPNINLSAGFTHYWGDNFAWGADAVYVGEYYSDLDNSDDTKAGDYTIVDARASYTIGDLTLNAYIKNLTDESAVYYRAGSLASVNSSRTFGLSAMYRL